MPPATFGNPAIDRSRNQPRLARIVVDRTTGLDGSGKSVTVSPPIMRTPATVAEQARSVRSKQCGKTFPGVRLSPLDANGRCGQPAICAALARSLALVGVGVRNALGP